MTFVPLFRRRRQGKTDYRARLALIKSGKVRAVVRRSISHTVVQFVKWSAAGDTTIAAATTAELKKYGWRPATRNVPAAYLVGLLAAGRAKAAGLTEAVLDIGLADSTKGNRIYAAVKGIIDAGITVSVSADMLPPAERIAGQHIAAWAATAAQPAFSKYGMPVAELPAHIAEVKGKITKGWP